LIKKGYIKSIVPEKEEPKRVTEPQQVTQPDTTTEANQ
jgi:hypothetical protein